MAIDFNSPGFQALLNSGLQLTGGVLNSMGQSKTSKEDRQFQAQRDYAQQMADFQRNQQTDAYNRDFQAMQASQLNPLAQQEARANFALKGDKVRQWEPMTADFDYDSGMGSFKGGMGNVRASEFTKGLFTPEAMANAEMQDFRMPLAHLNPNIPTPDLSAVGLPNTPSYNAVELARKGVFDQREEEKRLERDRMQRMWGEIANGQAEQEEEKKGSSWWKKLAKVGLLAGAGVATAMTGGAAAPLIGMAAGAGAGAIDGGWKGALLGAGTGALTGGIGGGAASGVKMGLGAATKSALTNPGTLMKMGGAITPGAAGQVLGAAGSFMPGPGVSMKDAGQGLVNRVKQPLSINTAAPGMTLAQQLASRQRAALGGLS